MHGKLYLPAEQTRGAILGFRVGGLQFYGQGGSRVIGEDQKASHEVNDHVEEKCIVEECTLLYND